MLIILGNIYRIGFSLIRTQVPGTFSNSDILIVRKHPKKQPLSTLVKVAFSVIP
jgi:hypothetical protein